MAEYSVAICFSGFLFTQCSNKAVVSIRIWMSVELLPGLVHTIANSGEDEILGQLNALGGTDNLNGLVLGLVPGNLDLAVALLADRVDLGTTRSNNMAIGLGVGKDEVARRIVLLSLLQGLDNGFLSLLNVLRRSSENPRDIAILARTDLDNLPRVDVGSGICIIRNQWESPADVASRSIGPRRKGLTSMINGNLVVVAKLTEELSTVGDGVVQAARNLDSLALLVLDNGQDVLLGLVHILGSTGDLDSGLSVTLTRNVNGDGKLRLHLALSITAAANQGAVVVNGDVHDLSNLALALRNDLLDALDDVLDNLSATLDLDAVTISLLLGELDSTGKLSSVIRTASFDNNVSKSSA